MVNVSSESEVYLGFDDSMAKGKPIISHGSVTELSQERDSSPVSALPIT